MQRVSLVAFVGVVLAGAGDCAQAENAAEAKSPPIGALSAGDDTSARGLLLPRLPSSLNPWTAVADYTFDANSNEIASADMGKARDVQSRLREVPSLRVGLDGSNVRRVDVVRDALIAAGVPSFKIQIGAFGDPQRRDEARVAVLVID